MKYTFHVRADADVTEAVRYYDEVSQGLGDAFVERLFEVLERRAQFPESAPEVLPGGVRRAVLSRFKHGVFFIVNTEIVVLRVLHLAQDPNRWPRIDENGE